MGFTMNMVEPFKPVIRISRSDIGKTMNLILNLILNFTASVRLLVELG